MLDIFNLSENKFKGNYTLNVMSSATMLFGNEVKVALVSVLSWSPHSMNVNLLPAP